MPEVSGVGPVSGPAAPQYETVDISTVIGMYKLGAALPYLTEGEKKALLETEGTIVQIPSQKTIQARISQQLQKDAEGVKNKIWQQISGLFR
jgi:hypothetical protein